MLIWPLDALQRTVKGSGAITVGILKTPEIDTPGRGVSRLEGRLKLPKK
jgi:hypothetical protein